jgi:hypothetical protein
MSWKYMRANRQAFIWSDDEEPTVTWNRLQASQVGDVAVTVQPTADDGLTYTFGDQTVVVPLRFNRDDRWLAIHALAMLVRNTSEIRFCRDSSHSSDVAFLPMSPEEWSRLEAVLDPTLVSRRFLKLNENFDSFVNEATTAEAKPKGSLAPEYLDWEGGPTYEPARLEYVIAADGRGLPRVPVLERVIKRHLEPGPITVGFRRSQQRQVIERAGVVGFITPYLATTQVRLMNAERTAFVVIEESGVAAGWRTDGKIIADPVARPRWQFWRS